MQAKTESELVLDEAHHFSKMVILQYYTYVCIQSVDVGQRTSCFGLAAGLGFRPCQCYLVLYVTVTMASLAMF